jgi:hypothetical protein
VVSRTLVASALIAAALALPIAAIADSPQAAGSRGTSTSLGGAQWVEFEDRTDDFFVVFPETPKVTTTMWTSRQGPQHPARVYTAYEGPGRYTMTVVDLADMQSVQELRAATSWEAWRYRKMGGEITYDMHGTIDGIPGHQLHIKNADKTTSVVGIYFHDKKLYVMEARVPTANPAGALLFEPSLSILDENGRRIRYAADEFGNPTKRVVEYGLLEGR